MFIVERGVNRVRRLIIRLNANNVGKKKLCTRMEIQKHVHRHLVSLEHVRGRQLGLEHTVPEPAGHAETVLVVCKMVLQVVLLELAVV